jgi:hypothetical protein
METGGLFVSLLTELDILRVDLAINMSRQTALWRFCSSFSRSQMGSKQNARDKSNSSRASRVNPVYLS